mmetsp:Transcript_14143/g.37335  ORF Transcript_14143/g.37335 Transcript_14143/m.37335 type:complete len:406 (+) Transcript_14143:563-1780(+)
MVEGGREVREAAALNGEPARRVGQARDEPLHEHEGEEQRDDSRGLAGSRVGPERRCDVEAGSHRVVPDVARGRQRFAELARRVERSSGRIECERKRAVVDRRAAVADPASKGAIVGERGWRGGRRGRGDAAGVGASAGRCVHVVQPAGQLDAAVRGARQRDARDGRPLPVGLAVVQRPQRQPHRVVRPRQDASADGRVAVDDPLVGLPRVVRADAALHLRLPGRRRHRLGPRLLVVRRRLPLHRGGPRRDGHGRLHAVRALRARIGVARRRAHDRTVVGRLLVRLALARAEARRGPRRLQAVGPRQRVVRGARPLRHAQRGRLRRRRLVRDVRRRQRHAHGPRVLGQAVSEARRARRPRRGRRGGGGMSPRAILRRSRTTDTSGTHALLAWSRLGQSSEACRGWG